MPCGLSLVGIREIFAQEIDETSYFFISRRAAKLCAIRRMIDHGIKLSLLSPLTNKQIIR